MGVRLALGASPGRLWMGVLLQTLGAVGVGLLAGSVAAVAATRVLQAHLGTGDIPRVVAAVALLSLAMTSVVAAAVPARRIVAVDPLVALKANGA